MGNSRGFTLAEVLIASAFFITMSGMGIALLGSAVPSIRADTEANRLISLLQIARESAIARQRDVEVRINIDNSSVQLVRHDEGVEVPIAMLVFESGVQLRQFSGMGDTEAGFGAGSAADFGDADTLTFAPDGSFLDENDLPRNGTFFLGVIGKTDTARAITLTGTTARPRLYRWRDAGGWVAR